MSALAKRRWLAITLLVLASLGAWFAWRWLTPNVPRLPYLSGWLLLLLMLVLTAYNGRKKLPFLPLLRSETWLQFHVYLGYFSSVLFGLHLGLKLPTGAFASSLAWLFILVTLSGIAGLFLSRTFPKRLTTRGGEVLFEHIPNVRRALSERAEALALQSLAVAKSTTITDFYTQHLQAFFSGPRHLLSHWLEIRAPVNQLLHRISELSRYLNADERKLMDEMAALVRQKDGLDYHYALQLGLKLWLFVHIPLTYSLLIFSFVHLVLVYAFAGGTR